MRKIEVLKYGWKFKKGDFQDAINFDFDDSNWEEVQVPHDWAIKGPFSPENDKRVYVREENGRKKEIVLTGVTGGLPHAGKGWYRKKIELKNIKDKRIRIEFDGVMSNSKVYCNGIYVGQWPYGYASFAFDITDFIKEGENLIAVSVDNKPNASRWYPGAGIYRNVRLVIMNNVHIPLWGTYITTPYIDEKIAKVHIKTEVENHTGKSKYVELETKILSPEGKEIITESTIKEISDKGIFEQEIFVENPLLWSVENPNLYTACLSVKIDGKVVDYYQTRFGIRTITFDSEKGFFLNGKDIKFKGVCMHHDLGPLGAAVNKIALKRQLTILKEMGCNAIRTSHNPPCPELLDLADEMGFLVIDEAFDEWKIPKCENGYNKLFDEWAEKDLRAMIRRDRNHPSVIMWSIGNEIPEQTDPVNGPKLAKFLHNICKEEDPTRPTTTAMNWGEEAIKNGFAQVVDVCGWNYLPHLYGKFHQLLPGKPMYASETASCISTRGEYYFPVEEERDVKRETLQVNSFDLSHPSWANIPDVEFKAQDEHPFIMGEFVWTGFDYLGEPTPYNEEWPSRSSYFGIVDLCGIPKDRFYLYQSIWADKETLHIVPHWTLFGFEGKAITVQVYSKWNTVELFVNGISYGKKTKHSRGLVNRYRLVWNGVIYQPGEVKAVVYDEKGNVVKETVVKTAGKPSKIKLIPDREIIKGDGEDMVFVYVEVVGEKGVLCPFADNLIHFDIKGPAEIVAVDNGNPISTEPFCANYRKVFHGKCVVYIRSIFKKKGKIKITAKSEGLKGAQIIIKAE
ncbi:MAG TPA: beta-galactosidase GalB [bacterium]|nr:beta-galactosidase GalB [bacterium]HOM26333.1 beta-galactosidase GalB [bacterium]